MALTNDIRLIKQMDKDKKTILLVFENIPIIKPNKHNFKFKKI